MIAAAAGLALILLQGALVSGRLPRGPGQRRGRGAGAAVYGIRIWGAPATIALYAITGWLIAVERTRAVLVLQLWINGVNIALDLWFVLGLGWGVPGVAVATLIAEWTGLALGLWLCRDAFGAARGADRARLVRPRAAAARWVAVNPTS